MSEVETIPPDEVTMAVQVAKAFFLHAFKDERIENLGLEEVKHHHGRQWQVTLGFSRGWEPPTVNSFLQAAAAATRFKRTYKTVTVDLDGPKGLSIINRRDD